MPRGGRDADSEGDPFADPFGDDQSVDTPPPPLPQARRNAPVTPAMPAPVARAGGGPPPPLPPAPRSASVSALATSTPAPSPPMPMPAARRPQQSPVASPVRSPKDAPPPPLAPRPTAPAVRQARLLEQQQQQQPQSPMSPMQAPALPARPSASSSVSSLSERPSTLGRNSGGATSSPMGSYDKLSKQPDARQDVKVTAPDFTSSLNRRPPAPDSYITNNEISHKGAVKQVVVSGFYVCTAGQQNLRLYYIPSGENVKSLPLNDTKVTGLALVPCADPEDEGSVVWIGTEKGDIISADLQSGTTITILDKRNAHTAAISHMIRYRNSIWTLDENGGLRIWSDLDGRTGLSAEPPRMKIGSRQERLAIAKGRLWAGAGRSIEIYNPDDPRSIFQQRVDLSGHAGAVTAMATSRDEDRVYSGHDDGKVIIWSTSGGGGAPARLAVAACSPYRVSALLAVPSGDLWVGFATGKVHVYDTSASPWVALKDFGAHASAPVTDLVLDEKSLLASGRQTVMSFSADAGQIRLWDGFLSKDVADSYVKSREAEYSTYRRISAFVGSWNINAIKPDAPEVSSRVDKLLSEWFGVRCSPPPTIIVIGFQELVDLES
ncbi:hypothetical protein HK405_013780, partial [Cladochytrium tenue]